ncbi:hypothetical protein BH23BAC3_BH23BAC3_31180 [soil metagenome]
MILAIETSTPVCSVALQRTNSFAWEKRIVGKGVHSERLFTFTEELLGRASVKVKDLDAILFSRGPGSYTGLRIGAAAVKGFLYGHEVPLFTFPTLISFAAGLPLDKSHHDIFSVIDARRNHLYIQRLQSVGGTINVNSYPEVEEIPKIEDGLTNETVLAGTGWERLNLENHNRDKQFGMESVSAKSLLNAWNTASLKKYFTKEDPKTFEPEYLELAQINNSKIR